MENDINNSSATSGNREITGRERSMNIRNRKKQLAAYLNMHKRWVLVILVLMVIALAIWFSSDNDKGLNKEGENNKIKIDNSR